MKGGFLRYGILLITSYKFATEHQRKRLVHGSADATVAMRVFNGACDASGASSCEAILSVQTEKQKLRETNTNNRSAPNFIDTYFRKIVCYKTDIALTKVDNNN